MFNPASKQLVFEQKNGIMWNFFMDEDNGLCCSLYSPSLQSSSLESPNLQSTKSKSSSSLKSLGEGRYGWSSPVSLQKNLHQNFFADMDDDDNFHLFFQDAIGNLYYSYFENENIRTRMVLNSRKPAVYNKHLTLIPRGDAVHFFYVLNLGDGRKLLSWQSCSTPSAIDYMPCNTEDSGQPPYCAVFDKAGRLYVFYHRYDSRNYQVGYKMYDVANQSPHNAETTAENPLQKSDFWSGFYPVSSYKGDCENIRVTIDESSNCNNFTHNDIVHIVYERKNTSESELIYCRKTTDELSNPENSKKYRNPENRESQHYVLYSSIHPISYSSILCNNKDGRVIVYWFAGDELMYCESRNAGKTFGKVERYIVSSGNSRNSDQYRDPGNTQHPENYSGSEYLGSADTQSKAPAYNLVNAGFKSNLSKDWGYQVSQDLPGYYKDGFIPALPLKDQIKDQIEQSKELVKKPDRAIPEDNQMENYRENYKENYRENQKENYKENDEENNRENDEENCMENNKGGLNSMDNFTDNVQMATVHLASVQKDLSNDFAKLRTMHETLERQLVKVNVKLGIVEGDAARCKELERVMKNLYIRLDELEQRFLHLKEENVKK